MSTSSFDFSVFGPVQRQPISRIQKIVGATLVRNWATISHVTHHDEADISGLDVLRRQLAEQHAKGGLPVPGRSSSAARARTCSHR